MSDMRFTKEQIERLEIPLNERRLWCQYSDEDIIKAIIAEMDKMGLLAEHSAAQPRHDGMDQYRDEAGNPAFDGYDKPAKSIPMGAGAKTVSDLRSMYQRIAELERQLAEALKSRADKLENVVITQAKRIADLERQLAAVLAALIQPAPAQPDHAALVARLRAAYDLWNSVLPDGLPPAAGVVLEAAAALSQPAPAQEDKPEQVPCEDWSET